MTEQARDAAIAAIYDKLKDEPASENKYWIVGAVYDHTREQTIDEFVRRVEALIASSTNEQGVYGFITATQLRAVAKEMKDDE